MKVSKCTTFSAERDISEVCAKRQLQQRPDRELVARYPNGIAAPHTTSKGHASSEKVTSHHSTAHITPGEQQTTPENRLLHVAVEVIIGTVKLHKPFYYLITTTVTDTLKHNAWTTHECTAWHTRTMPGGCHGESASMS